MSKLRISWISSAVSVLMLCLPLLIMDGRSHATEPPADLHQGASKKENHSPIPLNHCSFGPTAAAKEPSCSVEFSVCLPADDWCVQNLFVKCGERRIYQGLYITSFAPQVVTLEGVPYADVGEMPKLALYFRRPDRARGSFMFAVLNHKGQNRQGDCHIERHPIPTEPSNSFRGR